MRPILLAGLTAALATACSDKTTQTDPPPRLIAWEKAQAADSAEQRKLTGVLQSAERAPISFEVGGRVASVAVEIGDTFEAGDVLASLDQRTYRLTLEERRSQLRQAKAARVEAQRDYERQQTLHGEGWVSQAGYDTALARLQTAESRVETAAARLGIAEEDMADTTLEAPYGGTVAERLIEPSQQVQPGQRVFEIRGQGGGLEVSATVPETLVDRLKKGSRHTVTLPARPDMKLQARLTEIGSEAIRRNAFPVTLTLSQAPDDLRTGMTAEITFDLNEPSAKLGEDAPTGTAVTIPASAYLSGTGSRTVAFVYDPETATLTRTEITVADIRDNRAYVTQGLSPGDIVATKGLPYLEDGQKVQRLGIGVARYNQ